jgi:hypothetical protein
VQGVFMSWGGGKGHRGASRPDAPRGLSFTDQGNGTGVIAGTPATGSCRRYPVTITATNTPDCLQDLLTVI